MRVYIHSRRGLDIAQLREAHEAGTIGDPAPYGLDSAERRGLAVTYSSDRPVTKLSQYWFDKLGFDFLHALDNRSSIRRADVIWTVLEWEWMSIALAQRLKLLPKIPIVANSVWLADSWPKLTDKKRRFFRWLMMPHMELTVHSAGALAYFAKVLPDVTFRLSRFGISTNAFPVIEPRLTHTNGRPIKVYAIGHDSTRDWQTMLMAFGNDSRFHVTIVCKWLHDYYTKDYWNLEIPRISSINDQRDMYDKADIVIVPMSTNRFSGITVLLEAAARGKPVIASATGGVDTYLGPGEVLLVPPGEPEALRDAVLSFNDHERFALAKAAQERFVKDGYSADGMVARYVESSNRLLSRHIG